MLDLGTEVSHGNNWIRETGSLSPVRYVGAEARAQGLGPIPAKYNCYSDSSATRFDADVAYLPTDCDNVGELRWIAALQPLGDSNRLYVSPNPSGGSVTIRFRGDGVSARSSLAASVFDIAGRRVADVQLQQIGGEFVGSWDGRLGHRGVEASRGIYFVRVRDESGSFTAKVQRIR